MKIVLHAPVSPCSLVGKKEQEVYKFVMSCGGGMGGSRWDEYVITEDAIRPNSMLTCKDAATGEEKIINSNYIVMSKKVRFVTVTWDTTAWVNYNGNYNSKKCKKQTQILNYQIPASDTYTVEMTYGSTSDNKYFVDKQTINVDL